MPVETGILTSADITRLRTNVFKVNEWAEGNTTHTVTLGGATVPSPAKLAADTQAIIDTLPALLGSSASGVRVQTRMSAYTGGTEETTITGVATGTVTPSSITITPLFSSSVSRIILRGSATIMVISGSADSEFGCRLGVRKDSSTAVGLGSFFRGRLVSISGNAELHVSVLDTSYPANTPITFDLKGTTDTSGLAVIFKNVLLTAEEVIL